MLTGMLFRMPFSSFHCPDIHQLPLEDIPQVPSSIIPDHPFYRLFILCPDQSPEFCPDPIHDSFMVVSFEISVL